MYRKNFKKIPSIKEVFTDTIRRQHRAHIYAASRLIFFYWVNTTQLVRGVYESSLLQSHRL